MHSINSIHPMIQQSNHPIVGLLEQAKTYAFIQ